MDRTMANTIETAERLVLGVLVFLRHVAREERAQDGFEYLLVAGTVGIALAVGFLAVNTIIPAVVGYACPAIDTVSPVAVGACINP
jgi:hypothetical protein